MTFKSDIWLLLWIGLVALVAYTSKLKRKETVLGQETERYSLAFAIITFLPVFLFVSVGEIRADIWTYYDSFIKLSDSFSDVIRKWWEIKGPGYALIEVLIKDLFGHNFDAYRIIFGLIQSIPLVLIFRKYSENYVMTVFFFITMGICSHWMMNGLRQFVAVCITFLALPYLNKKKFIPALLIILLASTIHTSAMMMIPIALVSWLKPWGKPIVFSYLVFVVALFIFVNNTNLLAEETVRTDDGAHPLRILINAAPAIVAFIGRKRIADNNNSLINICVNMSVFSPLIYLVATFTNGIGTGRLPIYTNLYNLILIPYLCESVFDEKTSKILRLSAVLYYLVYFYSILYLGV